VTFAEKAKKISRRDAKTQRARKENHQLENLSFFLCVIFAALRLCVRFYFLDPGKGSNSRKSVLPPGKNS